MPPVIDTVLVQLFAASRSSADPATQDFRLRRALPVSIYVEGDDDNVVFTVGEDLREQIKLLLEQTGDGYESVYEWGPFYGSYLVTIFGQSKRDELGGSFLKHSRDLVSDVLGLTTRIPPGVRVVLLVGSLTIHLGVAAAAAPIAVPLIVLEHIAYTIDAEEIAHAFKEAFL